MLDMCNHIIFKLGEIIESASFSDCGSEDDFNGIIEYLLLSLPDTFATIDDN